MQAKVDRAEVPKKLGIRERSKRETRTRIIQAARQLFAEYGYDGTTMRQIAAGAGMGLGTLANYVAVKRDLIYLIFNEEMDALTDLALGAPRSSQSFTEKMLAIAEHHYRMFAEEPVLSRILLSEILQHTPGMHLERYLRIRNRLIRGIEAFVVQAQRDGEINMQPKADVIALNVFFLISTTARWFLDSAEPDWHCGLTLCESMLKLLTAGLTPPST